MPRLHLPKLHFSIRRAAPFAVAAAMIGVIVVVFASAAGTAVSFQPETGTLANGATVTTVTGQSGSGAVRFKTATPTPTPGAFQSNCIVSPHVCGYPDETNTGVPAGTVLTNSGSITVTQNGAIIENKNIIGQVVVHANNVIIRKSRITSSDYYPIDYDAGYTGLLVEDTEIAGTSPSVTSGIGFANYTARRVNVHGGSDGLKADRNVTIEDSYIHNLVVTASSHNDGVQGTGGSNVTIRHTTCKLSTTSGANACLQIGTENGPTSNWLVTNNLLDGGGWTINQGQNNTGMQFIGNRFTRNAAYGPGSVDGVTWTGNYYDDNGAVAN